MIYRNIEEADLALSTGISIEKRGFYALFKVPINFDFSQLIISIGKVINRLAMV